MRHSTNGTRSLRSSQTQKEMGWKAKVYARVQFVEEETGLSRQRRKGTDGIHCVGRVQEAEEVSEQKDRYQVREVSRAGLGKGMKVQGTRGMVDERERES